MKEQSFSKESRKIICGALSSILTHLSYPIYDAINISPAWGKPHPLAPALKKVLEDPNMKSPNINRTLEDVKTYTVYLKKFTTALNQIGM